MPRQARLDVPGTLHHVIIRGIEKRRIVDDETDRHSFVSRMGKIASDTSTPIYAWALMPNHAHILLRSGLCGLSKYMRRLLTGYAATYNRRHGRYGHLFQNRYKSIVCDEDAYFLELVRYIHLNPLRADLVKDMSELERHRWCGHGVILGKMKNNWQAREYVLSWFGAEEVEAKKSYRQYVQKGVEEGRRPELVGGGLIRSVGGWSQVLSLRRNKEGVLSDERILGCGNFVERVIGEADERLKYQLPTDERRKMAEKLIEDVCKRERINVRELRAGSRRGQISQVRLKLASQLVEHQGFPLAEVARQLGISTSGISKALERLRRRSKST